MTYIITGGFPGGAQATCVVDTQGLIQKCEGGEGGGVVIEKIKI